MGLKLSACDSRPWISCGGVGQRVAAVAVERQLQRYHQLAFPAGRAGIALVAGGAEGAHQVFAAAEHQRPRRALLIGRDLDAGRYPQGIGAGDDAVLRVEQQHVGALRGIAVGVEDGLHLLLEIEAQAQHAGRLAGFRVQHAVRIHQRARLAGTQIGGAEGFDVAGRLQRLRQQRVVAASDRNRGIGLHQHAAFQVQQQDLVVDGVLVAIAGQALAGLGLVAIEAGDKAAQVDVGGEKADIGGALVQVAHQDVDRVARLGAQVGQHVAHLFLHQIGHQCTFQVRESGAGGHHGRQQQAGFGGAVHLRGGLDKSPHLIQFPQRQLATGNIGHMG